MMIPKMLHCMGVEMHIGWQAETAEQRMKEKSRNCVTENTSVSTS